MKIPCVIVRGGTSRGIYVRETDLPVTEPERTHLICQLFGSPNVRQIDGLGGGDPLTSKVGILSNMPEGKEIGYLSGEVRLGKREVNYGIMCGNLAAGVFQAAYYLGLTSRADDNCLKIQNINNQIPIVAAYENMEAALAGEAVNVKLVFQTPGGAKTGKLLPLGEVETKIDLDSRIYRCSIVESGAIYCFVPAADFGLVGDERPEQLDMYSEFKAIVERLRARVAELISMQQESLTILPGQVKVAILGSNNGQDGDITGRIINPAATHKAYAVSGAIATCTAANIRGTVVSQLVAKLDKKTLSINHPEGLLQVGIDARHEKDGLHVKSATIYRESRLLMSGDAYLP